MPLCTICKSIPFRKIIEGDESLPVAQPKDALSTSYHVRSHDSISQLIDSGTLCDLCSIIVRALKSSLWYQHMMRDEDKSRPVWLCLPVGSFSPVIWIYLGQDMPETKIFGKDVKIYAALDDPLAKTIGFRYVHESPTQNHPLKQIDSWLDNCLSEHPQCSHVAKQQMKLPTRVLDLDALPRREAMISNKSWHALFCNAECKLVENYAQEQGQYIALSYCWGTTLAYKTTKDNRESHIRGFDFGRLPKSLQDAIFLTRYLGLRYIWIDCLCIVQDDKEDWQREAAFMADVYSNSYLTIAAERASDSGKGFLGPRKIRSMDLISFEDNEGTFQLYFYAYDVSAMPGAIESASLEPLRSEPLSKRVWTLQERLLPVRTLHFATDQMYWECAKTSMCEDGETFGSGDEDFRLSDIADGLQSTSRAATDRRLWYKLIQAYTSRNMTYLSDKLPALSGVIAMIQRQTNDSYYAGIWKAHFLEGLLWRLEDPDLDLYVMVPKPPKRPDFWRAPSWSFAAVEGVVRYQELYSFGTDFCAKLEQCSLTPSGLNPLGELKAGFIRIRGPMTAIEQIGQERTSEGLDCYLRLRDRSLVKGKVFFDFEKHENSAVLMLTPHTGLVITLVDKARNDYVRVGVVQVWKDPDNPPLSASKYSEPASVVLL